MTFQIDAVRKEFNAVSVDKEEALEKRLARLTRDRCTNYRKKVHNLQVRLLPVVQYALGSQIHLMACQVGVLFDTHLPALPRGLQPAYLEP